MALEHIYIVGPPAGIREILLVDRNGIQSIGGIFYGFHFRLEDDCYVIHKTGSSGLNHEIDKTSRITVSPEDTGLGMVIRQYLAELALKFTTPNYEPASLYNMAKTLIDEFSSPYFADGLYSVHVGQEGFRDVD
jgi:hypothetical protein